MNLPTRTASDGSVLLTLHVQPGASRTELAGMHGDALKLRVHAPPLDGRANAEVLKFLAARLDIAVSRLSIAQGESARRKVVRLPGECAARIRLLETPT
jgi:uncharacterized protein (TIGR00251 family)